MNSLPVPSAADLSRLIRKLVKTGAPELDQLRRYQAFADAQWIQIDLLRSDLIECGQFGLASTIPSRSEISAQFEQIAKHASAGKKTEVAAIAQSLNNAFRTAAKVARNANAERKSSAVSHTHAILAQCGRGMLQSVFNNKNFRLAMADRVASVRLPRPSQYIPNLPVFTETNIIKPGSRKYMEVSALPSAETDFVAKYGKVDDLPMTIVAPLALGNAIAVDLPAEAFLAKKTLDSDALPEDASFDYTELLRKYASKHGEIRYFYVTSSSMFRRTQESNTSDQPLTSTQLRESLRKSLTAHLLFNTPSDVNKLGTNVGVDVFDFRQRVLNWGTMTLNGTWIPRSSGASHFAPETLSQEISKRPFLRQGAQRFWEQVIDTEISRVIGNRTKQLNHAIAQAHGGGTEDDQTILEHSAQALRYLYYAGSSSRSGNSLSIPVRPWLSELDIDFVRRFLASPMSFYAENKPEIKRRLSGLTDLFKQASENIENWEISDRLIRNWTVHPDYLLFVETAKTQAEKAINLESSIKLALDRALQTIRDQSSRIVNAYCELEKEVANGLFFEEWASIVASILKNACLKKRILTDPFQPLVLRSASSYNALGPVQFLERIPMTRETSFYAPRPSVGVIKEYRLELQHAGFGLGKHLYSQTLFPGETVSIEMTTKMREKETQAQSSAENIFEEAGTETLDEFSSDLRLQLQNENRANRTSETEVGANASGDLFGIINIDMNASGKWSSLDEERIFSDRVDNVLSKLSNKLSQKRQVQLDLKSDTTQERETETSTATSRSYSNLNKEKNLTVNFFQVTRKHRSAIYLDHLHFYYSSGRFPLMKIFVPRAITEHEAERILGAHPLLNQLHSETGVDYTLLLTSGIVSPMPSDLWDEFPENAVIVILSTPYTLSIPFSNVNAFLVGNFEFEKAREINGKLWTMIGGGQASPEGLSVCAFPFGKNEEPTLWPHKDTTEDEWTHTSPVRKSYVCADRIEMQGSALVQTLPNLDLRKKRSAALDTRYVASADGANALPKLLATRDYVINTNGVYAENMLGQCGALEEYATRHRELDVRQKEIEIERAAFGLERDREQSLLSRKYRAPARCDFADEGEYDRAVADYQRLRSIDTVKEHRIAAPPGVTVNLSLDASQNGATSVSELP